MGGLDVVQCLKEVPAVADGNIESAEEAPGFKGLVSNYMARLRSGGLHDAPLRKAGPGGKSMWYCVGCCSGLTW